MTFRVWLSNLFRNLRHGSQIERELDDEVRSAFEISVDDKIRSGLSPASARRAVAIEFVKLFNTEFHQVVGVVKNTRHGSLGNEPPPILYRPLTQVYQSNVALLVRSKNPEAVVGTVRGQVQQLDPRLPITDTSTLSNVLYTALWTPRMAAWLLSLLGGVSLMLALIGIYGVMAYSVSQRTRELGIRVALGADSRDVIRLIVGHGFRLSLVGIAIGLGASLVATRFIAGLLYGSATDVVTFVSVPAILAASVLAASYLPARRATRIEPTIALRSDA